MSDAPPTAALDEDRALAAACAVGDAAALAKFDTRFAAEVAITLRRMRLGDEAVAEVKQRVYERLFVAAPGARPRIAEYQGRGNLGGWLRVVVVRTALNFLRERADLPLDDALLAGLAAPGDPELELMKQKYRGEFQDSFKAALATLDAREQNLLRHVVIDGLDPGRIGKLYQVHRTTAMRWIDAAKQALLDRTRAGLMAKLRIGVDELDSIMRLIESQLEVEL
jgi:RNA polymerase sigma-70 factor, ECF subfamily